MKKTALSSSGKPRPTRNKATSLVTVAAIRAQDDAGVRRQRRLCREHAQELGLVIAHDEANTRSFTEASVIVELTIHRVDGVPKEHHSVLGAALRQAKKAEIMQLSARIAALALDVAAVEKETDKRRGDEE